MRIQASLPGIVCLAMLLFCSFAHGEGPLSAERLPTEAPVAQKGLYMSGVGHRLIADNGAGRENLPKEGATPFLLRGSAVQYNSLHIFVALALVALLVILAISLRLFNKQRRLHQAVIKREQESENNFHQLTESIREVFWLGSPDWRQVFYISPAYETVWGRSRQSLYDDPMSWIEALPESDRESVDAFLSEWKDSAWEKLDFPEYRIKRADGELRWINARAYAIRDAEGETYRVAGIAEDISERKRIELALQASEAYLRLIMDSAAEGIYTLDGTGRCTSINRAGLSLLGYEAADQLVGKNMHQMIHHSHPDGSPYALEASPIFKAIQNDQQVHIDNEVFWHKDGSSIPVEYWSYPLRQESGDKGVVVTFFDITERKFNQELLASRLRLLDYAQDHDIHELLVYTLDEASQATGSQVGFYHFLDADQKTISLQAWSTRTTQEFCQAVGGGLHYDLDEAGVWADAVRRREPVIHNDYAALPHKQGLPDGHAEVIRELMVPVFRGDKIVAIMGVGNKPLLAYDESDVYKISGLADLAWEIVERKQVEERLAQSEKQLSGILDTVTEGVALWDELGRLKYVNQGFSSLFGPLDDQPDDIDLPGQRLAAVMSDKTSSEASRLPLQQVLQDGEPVENLILQIAGQDGDPRWVKFNIHPLFDAGRERITGVVSSATDITEQRSHERQLEQLAHYDLLTGLPNRHLAIDRLKQLVAQAKRTGNLLAVCYLDLDGFKAVNDACGHEAGDELLKETARRLAVSIRDGDTVARLGGDEFLILLSGLTDQFESQVIIQRILDRSAEPYSVANTTQTGITASLGVTFFPSDNSDSESLVRHADQAMYMAKREGKNRFTIYSQDYERRMKAQQQTVQEITSALERGELAIHYQPIIDGRDESVIGAEALIRWQHPILGMLKPAEFLPLIQLDSLMFSINEWVIRQALSQMLICASEGVPLSISVNLFSRQLKEEDFIAMLRARIAENGYDPTYPLVLEISETSVQADFEQVSHFVRECQGLGIVCALDDFGAGDTSLKQLRQVPVKALKIDRSIVQRMLDDDAQYALAAGVVGLADAFGRVSVAEGVETETQRDALLSIGCERMQGFYYAQPMDAQAFSAWLFKQNRATAWPAGVEEIRNGRNKA
ncbi:MAG: EAL domain-containing protein [Candidatus Thiodiazotropha sp. (ex Epidulcina cf. delphinae)]|nr:EAL domain-containing protein [Candidatus Thiodiazotropha sp. (ex Epidulcina cf. delphinae)]